MRILRLIWVLLTNGIAIYFFYLGAREFATLNHLLDQDNENSQVWLSFALKAAVPIVGIILEALNWRFAKWVNLAYFVFTGGLLLVTGLLNRSDYHGRIYLLFGVCGLLIALVSYFLTAGHDLHNRPHKTVSIVTL